MSARQTVIILPYNVAKTRMNVKVLGSQSRHFIVKLAVTAPSNSCKIKLPICEGGYKVTSNGWQTFVACAFFPISEKSLFFILYVMGLSPSPQKPKNWSTVFWVEAIPSLPAKQACTPLNKVTHTNPLYHGWRGHKSRNETGTQEGPVSVLSVLILPSE